MEKILFCYALCSLSFVFAETLDIAIWTPEPRDSLDRKEAFFHDLNQRTGIEFNLIQMPLSRAVVDIWSEKMGIKNVIIVKDFLLPGSGCFA